MAAVPQEATPPSWADVNRECLALEMRRIRLLMRRRACWLRQCWREDPLTAHRGAVISDVRADQLLLPANEAAERAFHREDPESRANTAQLASLESELVQRRKVDAGGASALLLIQDHFGLDGFERDVLALCFAVAEDPGVATLCAYLQDDASAVHPTLHLALELFCAPGEVRDDARFALNPAAPLRRFRLLHTAGDGSAATQHVLRIDERVADFIRGIDRVDERVVPLLQVMPNPPITGAQEELVAGLVRWAQAQRLSTWPLLNLTGPVGSGRRAVAAEFASRIGLRLFAIDMRSIPQADRERQEFVALLQREAALSRMAFYADVSDFDAGDRALSGSVKDCIERFTGTMLVAGRERWRFARAALHVEVPRPSAIEQQALWTEALKGVVEADGRIEEIVQQFDLGPEAISQVVQDALSRTRARADSSVLAAGDLWTACRDYSGAQLGSLAERLTPGYSWDDIVLPNDLLQQVRELADQVAARTQVYERWGFGKRLARGRGIAALFCGPSGTGKTMTAEILARHLQLDLYRIDLAGVVSKYIGETEKNLRNIFDAAEQSGAILFFDEADALFGKRTEVRDSHDRYANIEINYLLQRMEDYRGLAVLCTNRRSSLDRAFLRRLRFLIEFPWPDAEHRRRIWQKMFPPAAPLAALDFNKLARLEVSGGNIRNIAVNAAFLAAGAQEAIAERHVLQAARREYAKIDKLPTPAEFGSQNLMVRP